MKKHLFIVIVWLFGACCLFAQGLEAIDPLPDVAPGGSDTRNALPAPISHAIPQPVLHRIKDITVPEGERNNIVTGMGLVVGLSATGGRAEQTRLMAQNYFLRNGLSTDSPATGSMSAVIVTGTIPPYLRKGESIQVTVSVADDATSLRGGQLVYTTLKGHDGNVYAVASGSIIGGGISAGGAAANVQRDHPTAAVCNAIIEKEICCDHWAKKNRVQLLLRNKDASTAVSISNALNIAFPNSSAAIDNGTVQITIPPFYRNKVMDFMSVVGKIQVPVDQRARVVINQKTGTIVMGLNVRISQVVFANESLVITTTERPVVSQPAPFSQGQTVVLPRTSIDVLETGGTYNGLRGTTVGELASVLNQLGVSPNLMINVLTSLRTAGYLQAELVIE